MLFAKLRAHRSAEQREQAFRRFLPLARSLAARYRRSGEPLDDLEQVAGIGLLNAIDRFDPDRGVAFSSFAVPTILGELRRHFREPDLGVTRAAPASGARRADREGGRAALGLRLGRAADRRASSPPISASRWSCILEARELSVAQMHALAREPGRGPRGRGVARLRIGQRR